MAWCVTLFCKFRHWTSSKWPRARKERNPNWVLPHRAQIWRNTAIQEEGNGTRLFWIWAVLFRLLWYTLGISSLVRTQVSSLRFGIGGRVFAKEMHLFLKYCLSQWTNTRSLWVLPQKMGRIWILLSRKSSEIKGSSVKRKFQKSQNGCKLLRRLVFVYWFLPACLGILRSYSLHSHKSGKPKIQKYSGNCRLTRPKISSSSYGCLY